MYVYVITNLLFPHLKYIGKTANPKQRWKQHCNCSSSKKPRLFLHRAMKKYGIDNFEFEVVETHESNEAASLAEQRLIQEYRTYVGYDDCSGYNMTLGGDGVDPETARRNAIEQWSNPQKRKVIEEANRQSWKSPKRKARHSLSIRTALQDPKKRQRRHELMLKRWENPEYRNQRTESMIELWADPQWHSETSSKIREGLKQSGASERLSQRNRDTWKSYTRDQREKSIARLQLGRQKKLDQIRRDREAYKSTEEFRQEVERREKEATEKRSSAMKSLWEDETARRNACDNMKKTWADPEKKAQRLAKCRETRERRKQEKLL